MTADPRNLARHALAAARSSAETHKAQLKRLLDLRAQLELDIGAAQVNALNAEMNVRNLEALVDGMGL